MMYFNNLRRRGKLTAADVDLMLREVRLALLEADVNYGVVKDFVNRVRERAIGVEVSKALNPAQQVIKIVNDELIATLGEPAKLNLTGVKPYAIMLVGLQGSGKTTAAAKLARKLRARRGACSPGRRRSLSPGSYQTTCRRSVRRLALRSFQQRRNQTT